MQLKLISKLADARTTVVASHKEDSIVWTAEALDKTTYTGEFDIFEQINAYWAYLPEKTQDEIFAVYKSIREIFYVTNDSKQLTLQLMDAVAELYRYHDLDSIQHWASFYCELRMPDTIKTVASPDHPRERTYLTTDYRQLVTLTIGLRPMIPIWYEYIHLTEASHGTAFKEFYAAKLLDRSSLKQAEAFKRLREFVVSSIPAEKDTSSSVFGGIGSEDFPDWMLGLILVRRLPVGDVRGLDPLSSLASYMHKYITSKVRGQDTSFVGVVKEKKAPDDRQEGDNNISKLEGYKVKESVPAGDIVTLAHYIDDLDRMALRTDPTLDMRLLYKSWQSVKPLYNEQISDCQLAIVQWVMADVVSPRGLMYVNKNSLIRVFAVAQAVLWHQGHQMLAALVSAVAVKTEGGSFLSGGDIKPRPVSPAQVEQLNALYPHYRRPGGRAKLTKVPNVAITALENICEQFSECDWRLTLPLEWVERLTGTKNRRFSVPFDIKPKLADLIIAIASRKN